MPKTNNFPPELYVATDNLIQNLLASEPFLAYQKSRVQYKSDSQAHGLIERLSALQAELRRQQTNGSVTQADIDELRAVQAQVQANATLIAHASTQQEAVNFLREINQEISQLLGVDFAILAKQSTC
ncbi:MAG: YlbF family regulator [Chloroflexi bacterium]|nr:YlbF family regulator [Chloroflexota bacterium]MCX6036515.1 YlbF family regulator [Chloroflexota bacterium]